MLKCIEIVNIVKPNRLDGHELSIDRRLVDVRSPPSGRESPVWLGNTTMDDPVTVW